MPNFIEIGGVTRKPLVDLTWNDPNASWMFCSFSLFYSQQTLAHGSSRPHPSTKVSLESVLHLFQFVLLSTDTCPWIQSSTSFHQGLFGVCTSSVSVCSTLNRHLPMDPVVHILPPRSLWSLYFICFSLFYSQQTLAHGSSRPHPSTKVSLESVLHLFQFVLLSTDTCPWIQSSTSFHQGLFGVCTSSVSFAFHFSFWH